MASSDGEENFTKQIFLTRILRIANPSSIEFFSNQLVGSDGRFFDIRRPSRFA